MAGDICVGIFRSPAVRKEFVFGRNLAEVGMEGEREGGRFLYRNLEKSSCEEGVCV